MRIFLSYAERDAPHRERLERHLSALQQPGTITLWHEDCAIPGANKQRTAAQHLESADIVLSLLSADYLASKWAKKPEQDLMLARHQRGELLIIPVLVRPVHWETTAFARLQALPSNGKPVTIWRKPDAAWANVAAGVHRAIEALSTRRMHAGPAVRIDLPHDPNGVRLYLCSELLDFTLPVQLDLDAPVGYHLDRLVSALQLPRRIDHAGRIGMTLNYELAVDDKALHSQASLRAQAVSPGQVISLWIRSQNFAGRSPMQRDRDETVYRTGEKFSFSQQESYKLQLVRLLRTFDYNIM